MGAFIKCIGTLHVLCVATILILWVSYLPSTTIDVDTFKYKICAQDIECFDDKKVLKHTVYSTNATIKFRFVTHMCKWVITVLRQRKYPKPSCK